MLSLIACILSTTVVLICLKFIGRLKLNLWMTLLINYVICFSVSGTFSFIGNDDIRIFSPDLSQLILGVLFVLGFLFTQIALKANSLQKTTLFQRLSLLIPILVAIIYLGEDYSYLQVPGFLLAFVAMYFLSVTKGEKIRMNLDFGVVLLFLVWFVNGCIDSGFMLVSQESMTMLAQISFLAPIFFIALILTAVIALSRNIRMPRKNEILVGIVLGLANVAGIFFFMGGLEFFRDDAIFVTLNHCGIILLAGICGSLIFNEKITRRMWIGTVIAIIAIAWLINTK